MIRAPYDILNTWTNYVFCFFSPAARIHVVKCGENECEEGFCLLLNGGGYVWLIHRECDTKPLKTKLKKMTILGSFEREAVSDEELGRERTRSCKKKRAAAALTKRLVCFLFFRSVFLFPKVALIFVFGWFLTS